jgi:hypothetical protein
VLRPCGRFFRHNFGSQALRLGRREYWPHKPVRPSIRHLRKDPLEARPNRIEKSLSRKGLVFKFQTQKVRSHQASAWPPWRAAVSGAMVKTWKR